MISRKESARSAGCIGSQVWDERGERDVSEVCLASAVFGFASFFYLFLVQFS